MRRVAHDTGPSNLAHQDGNNDGNSVVTTIHRCFPLLVHKIYSEVAMVTIQEVLLWLPSVISGIETF